VALVAGGVLIVTCLIGVGVAEATPVNGVASWSGVGELARRVAAVVAVAALSGVEKGVWVGVCVPEACVIAVGGVVRTSVGDGVTGCPLTEIVSSRVTSPASDVTRSTNVVVRDGQVKRSSLPVTERPS
jgi:hypothetical protein